MNYFLEALKKYATFEGRAWSGHADRVRGASVVRRCDRGTSLRTRLLSLCAVVAPLGGVAVADETFRCQGQLVEAGMTQAQVRQLCGEPTSKSTEVQDVRSGNRVTGTTEVHRWTYASYSETRVLVFDQDRLRAIE